MPSSAIVILTGAGISKEEPGLDTFRDADGLWSRVWLEDVVRAYAEALLAGPCRRREPAYRLVGGSAAALLLR